MGGEPNYWRETGVRGCEVLELGCDILLFMSRTSAGSSKGPNAPPPPHDLLSLQMLAGCFNICEITASSALLFSSTKFHFGVPPQSHGGD